MAQPNYLRGIPDKDGYRRFGFSRASKHTYFRAARIVLLAFVGPPPSPLHEAAHGDGNQQNDALNNLRWATPAENEADKILHGTKLRGERHGSSRITAATVRRIRKLRVDGLTHKQIAERTGATKRNVGNVLRGVSWRHVA